MAVTSVVDVLVGSEVTAGEQPDRRTAMNKGAINNAGLNRLPMYSFRQIYLNITDVVI
jgi:hypothetical protein